MKTTRPWSGDAIRPVSGHVTNDETLGLPTRDRGRGAWGERKPNSKADLESARIVLECLRRHHPEPMKSCAITKETEMRAGRVRTGILNLTIRGCLYDTTIDKDGNEVSTEEWHGGSVYYGLLDPNTPFRDIDE